LGIDPRGKGDGPGRRFRYSIRSTFLIEILVIVGDLGTYVLSPLSGPFFTCVFLSQACFIRTR
jgi:hypothetical protein